MSQRRTAAIVTDGKKVLVCHAPNRKDKPNTWDLPKGHCNGNEDYYDCGMRELREETGIVEEKINGSVLSFSMAEPIPYKNDMMGMICLLVSKLPELDTLKCTSYFEWKGEQYPEVSKFEYVDIDELDQYLYKSLVKDVLPTLKKFIEYTIGLAEEVGLKIRR